jgi:pentatricopeptide repeat protein
MLAEGVSNKTSKVLEVMHSCIRLRHGYAAVKLFDQMLQTGASPKAHLIGKAVSHKFFKLVVETLDDKRIREDGLRLLDLIQAHAIAPAPETQNRLLASWKNQLPEFVLKYFLEMKDSGIILCRRAYCYIVVAHERSDPEFALRIYSEMIVSGIPPDKAACNAVLGARSQLGMLDEARELFLQMVDSAVVPNGKTYGIMIKVYSASNHLKEAIALFETMREQCFEPDRYAYHHAIRSCVALHRFEYAADVYNVMVQKEVPPLVNTLVLLSGACKNAGWNALAAELMTDLARAEEAETMDEFQL